MNTIYLAAERPPLRQVAEIKCGNSFGTRTVCPYISQRAPAYLAIGAVLLFEPLVRLDEMAVTKEAFVRGVR